MISNEFEVFLSEVLPPLGLSPSAHRRRNIRRRIVRRMESAGIHELSRYGELVRRDPLEREALRVSLERAVAGRYPESSLRELPRALRSKYFEREGDSYRICGDLRSAVSFRKMDLLCDVSPGRFGLILCRNAAFTYFGPDQRLSVARRFGESLEEEGYLVLGRTETLPADGAGFFAPAFPGERIFQLRP